MYIIDLPAWNLAMSFPVEGLIVSIVSEPATNSLLMKRPVWTKHTQMLIDENITQKKNAKLTLELVTLGSFGFDNELGHDLLVFDSNKDKEKKESFCRVESFLFIPFLVCNCVYSLFSPTLIRVSITAIELGCTLCAVGAVLNAM